MTAKKKKVESPNVPKEIFAQVSPKSIGGRSLFEEGAFATSDNIQNYLSEREVTLNAVEDLKNAGFNVLQITNTTINISGSASDYKKAFGQEIIAEERESIKSGTEKEMVTYLDTTQTDVTGLIVPRSGKMANYIEGVAIETPYYTFAPNYLPPTKEYWHLNVPGDVSVGCNADRAHRAAITGKGVHVVMVDTGFYKHSFFAQRGYRVNPVKLAPGTLNPLTDDNGHGTGESANIFATAPDCTLTPMKWNFANSTAAFNSAVSLNPDIITCSWGSHSPNSLSAANQTLAAAIALAVARGIIVVFSAGNGHWGFPGQHPDVISAGGVYLGDNMSLRASNYSSGFDSNIYPGRRVPDVCGLVGQSPGAKYIMLPIQAGCDIDTDGAGASHPAKDETGANDGWATFSGTSAAAPQLAGVAALVKQACRRLSPSQVRDIMKSTAIDVTTGTSATGTSSTNGPDNSTGHGLINAYRAVLKAKLRCRFTVPPILPPVIVVPPVVTPVIPPIIPPVLPPVAPPVIPVIPPIGPVITSGDVNEGIRRNSDNFGSGDTKIYMTDEELDEAMRMVDDDQIDLDELM